MAEHAHVKVRAFRLLLQYSSYFFPLQVALRLRASFNCSRSICSCLQITSLLLLALKQLPAALAQFEAHVRLFRRVPFEGLPGLLASHHAWLCRCAASPAFFCCSCVCVFASAYVAKLAAGGSAARAGGIRLQSALLPVAQFNGSICPSALQAAHGDGGAAHVLRC